MRQPAHGRRQAAKEVRDRESGRHERGDQSVILHDRAILRKTRRTFHHAPVRPWSREPRSPLIVLSLRPISANCHYANTRMKTI